jgi:isoleucyl-tRNA synthetase
VNVKAIEVAASDTALVRLRAKANFRSLGKRYGKRTATVAAAAAALTSDQLRALERGEEVTLEVGGEATTYGPDDVVVEREVTSDWLVQSDGPYVVALDPKITPALRAEGLAREVVNRVQRIRKEAGYVYTDRIALWISGDATVLDAVRTYDTFIRGETLARRLEVGHRAPAHDIEQEMDIDGLAVVMGVQRFHDGREGVGPTGHAEVNATAHARDV